MLPFSSFSTAPVLRGTWTPSSTNHFYVPPLSNLSLLFFVTFVFLTLRCYLYFILRCHLFLFIKSYTFSYYPSFLSPDEASGRNVVLHSFLSFFFRRLDMGRHRGHSMSDLARGKIGSTLDSTLFLDHLQHTQYPTQ